jgi:hypothetical protein
MFQAIRDTSVGWTSTIHTQASPFRPAPPLLVLTFLAFLAVLLPSPLLAQNNQIDPIIHALQTGNANGISKYFGPSVDITLNNTTSTYSNAQGCSVIRDFFEKNKVQGFEIQHSSNSTARSSTFMIGALITNQGRYKVYLWLKPRDGEMIIKEIRFEK